MKVLIALEFYATFQITVSDIRHARQSIVVLVRQFSEAIAEKKPQLLKFTNADVMNTMAYFHFITEFPHVVRSIRRLGAKVSYLPL